MAGRPETWTLEAAIRLAEELVDWYKEDDDNIFMDEFFTDVKDLNPDTVNYLARKFPRSAYTDLVKRAKQMQAIRLMKGGLNKKYDKTMSIFLLKVHHGFNEEVGIMGRNEPEPEEEQSNEAAKQDTTDLLRDIRKRIGKE